MTTRNGTLKRLLLMLTLATVITGAVFGIAEAYARQSTRDTTQDIHIEANTEDIRDLDAVMKEQRAQHKEEMDALSDIKRMLTP